MLRPLPRSLAKFAHGKIEADYAVFNFPIERSRAEWTIEKCFFEEEFCEFAVQSGKLDLDSPICLN
jgi:hypothetical protein